MSRMKGSIAGALTAAAIVMWCQLIWQVQLGFFTGLGIGLTFGWLGYLAGWLQRFENVRSN